MSYPSASQGYYAGSFDEQPADAGRSALPRYTALAVLVLGFASYLLSYGPVPAVENPGWGVRFALLAGLLAGFGLIPRQTGNHKVVAVLAVAGFLDALAAAVGASGAGWALTVIVVVNGLQALATIGCLLQSHPADDPYEAYEAYAEYYAQLADYYGQYPQVAAQPEPQQHSGRAHARGHAQGQGEARWQGSAQANAPGRSAVMGARPAADPAAGYADSVGQAGYADFIGREAERTEVIDRAAARGEQSGQAGLPAFGQAPARAAAPPPPDQPGARPSASP